MVLKKKNTPLPKKQAVKKKSVLSHASPKGTAVRPASAKKPPRSSPESKASVVGVEKIPSRLHALLDKTEITELLTAFAHGIDRMDETLLRTVLHADALLDLGPGIFQGSANDYVRWILDVAQGVRGSHHLITNIHMDLEGDTAFVSSYFHVHWRVEKQIGREDVFLGGRHLDRLERRPSGSGVWKIAHRRQILDWARTESASDLFYHQNPDALWSARTKQEPSHQHRPLASPKSPSGNPPAFGGRRYDSKSLKF